MHVKYGQTRLRGNEMQKKKKKRRRRNRRQERNIRILGMVLILALIVMGLIQVILKSYIKKHDDGKILQGVTIGGIDVSGLTEEEALHTVEIGVNQ